MKSAKHALMKPTGACLWLAAALGVGAMTGCAGIMSRSTAERTDHLTAELPAKDWYGRGGGLVGSARVEHFAKDGGEMVMVEPLPAAKQRYADRYDVEPLPAEPVDTPLYEETEPREAPSALEQES